MNLRTALAVTCLATIIKLVSPVITFPKNSEAVSGDVLLPTDASLLLGLKSLEYLYEANAVISPANLYSCLWLLYAGAKGDTKSELGHVIGSHGSEVITSVRSLSGVQIANAAFVTTAATVKYEFAAAASRYIFSVDFAKGEDTRQTINGWVSEQTKGTIPTLLDTPLDSQTKAVVVSALYYNASWLYPFDPLVTKSSKFEVSPGDHVETVFMNRFAPFKLYKGPTYDAVGLPYDGNGFTLYLILPHTSGPRALRSLLRHLTPEEVNHMNSAATDTPLILSMPKFTVDHKMQLRPVLQSLGINKIFDPQFADFSDLIDQEKPEVFVGDVVQSVHLEVDEQGTRGGAATAAILTKSGKTTFVANRPFIYILRHESGHVLFLGVYSHPQSHR